MIGNFSYMQNKQVKESKYKKYWEKQMKKGKKIEPSLKEKSEEEK